MMDSAAVQQWLGNNIGEANTLSFNTTASTITTNSGKTICNFLIYCINIYFNDEACFVNADARA